MLLNLTAFITIGNYAFKGVHHVQIESSWRQLTTKAQIILPRKTYMKNVGSTRISLLDLIHFGDIVTINLGYNGDNNLEFTGYVTGIDPRIPVQINCEDAMWKLKTNELNLKTTGITTLKDFVNAIVPAPYNAGAQVADATFNSFYVNQGVTTVGAMEILKRELGFPFYFKNNILHAGLAYPTDPAMVNYHFQKNIITDNLEFQSAGEVKFRVKGVLLLPNHKTETITVGEKGGELVTLPYSGIDPTQLLKQVTFDYNRLHANRWKGSFTAFGQPYLEHGMRVNLKDDYIHERNGVYNVDKVITSFGVGGFRRQIFIGALTDQQPPIITS